MLLLSACELRFNPTATPTLTPTEPPSPTLVVVWAAGGDLFAWREGDPTPRTLASGGVIQPYLAPDAEHVAFTRGSQGDAASLWVVGINGTGEAQLVAPDTIPSIRNGHPQIAQVAWLDATAVYFNTQQVYDWGTVNDDNLYRAALGVAPSSGVPQLILPPGAGGVFAPSPDGQHLAVVRAGIYDTQAGSVALLDPLGVSVDETLAFTALSAPSEAPFYPPFAWSADSAFVRVPIPDRESDRVALWRVPVAGEAQIFGYVSAARVGLPVWSAERMLYLRFGETGALELVIADANGENAAVYISGGIVNPRWIDGDQFAYEREGVLWLGQVGQAPRLLLAPPAPEVVFLTDGEMVYAADGALRRARLMSDGIQPDVIAPLPEDAAFDAALMP